MLCKRLNKMSFPKVSLSKVYKVTDDRPNINSFKKYIQFQSYYYHNLMKVFGLIKYETEPDIFTSIFYLLYFEVIEGKPEYCLNIYTRPKKCKRFQPKITRMVVDKNLDLYLVDKEQCELVTEMLKVLYSEMRPEII